MIAHRNEFPADRPPRHRLAAFAIIKSPASGQVLLVRRRRGGRHWTLPGGKLRRAESLSEGLVREVREETGFTIEPGRLVAALERPGANKTLFYFECRIVSTARLRRRPLDEIMADGWFAPERLPTPCSPALRLLGRHCPEWWAAGAAAFRRLPENEPEDAGKPLLKLRRIAVPGRSRRSPAPRDDG